MILVPGYQHKLIFRIDNDAPDKFMDRWEKIKMKCEYGRVKKLIPCWLDYCKIESNKNMEILNRCEGGIGGNDNNIDKQIRFRNTIFSTILDNHIIMNVYDSETLWTYEELDDLVSAFRKFANGIVEAKCVRGSIELNKL